jgi:hypothetical protein
VWSFEAAMFPEKRRNISSYEYYIAPNTKTVALHSVSGENIRRLRLSGFLRLNEPLHNYKTLEHLTICGVTGNYFDQKPLTGMEGISLKSFQYSQGDRLGFEIRAPFLSSLFSGSHSSLTKLVLLQCSKLSTEELTSCLTSLTALDYFALSFITVNDLQCDFIRVLPRCTRTLKLKLTNARFTRPLLEEEMRLCGSLKLFFTSPPSPVQAHLHLPNVISLPSDKHEWHSLASKNGVVIRFGDWELAETI